MEHLDTQFLQHTPLAQLLFAEDTLVAASPAAKALLPHLEAGATVSQALGEAVCTALEATGELFFTAQVAGTLCDLTVTDLSGVRLVTVISNRIQADGALLQSIADQMRRTLSTPIALAPQLQLEENPKNLQDAAAINRSHYAMLRMAQNLEVMATPQLSLHLQRLELIHWLGTLVDQLVPMLEAAQLSLHYQIPAGTHYCDLDPQRMEQALLNLFSNTIKFAAPGTTVTLSLTFRGAGYSIALRDQGSGITPDRMGALFGHSTTATQLPDPRWGLGFGLPVTRRIVETHQGRLMLESHPQVGTVVYLSLPDTSATTGLRSPMKLPTPSANQNSALVALADALPDRLYDSRDL